MDSDRDGGRSIRVVVRGCHQVDGSWLDGLDGTIPTDGNSFDSIARRNAPRDGAVGSILRQHSNQAIQVSRQVITNIALLNLARAGIAQGRHWNITLNNADFKLFHHRIIMGTGRIGIVCQIVTIKYGYHQIGFTCTKRRSLDLLTSGSVLHVGINNIVGTVRTDLHVNWIVMILWQQFNIVLHLLANVNGAVSVGDVYQILHKLDVRSWVMYLNSDRGSSLRITG